MYSRSVVIRRNQNQWRPEKKTKIKTKNEIVGTAGFISPLTVTVVFAVFSALLYVYSINQSAIKGYQIRKIEKEISQMRNDNELLKIKEAELRSFYKIKEMSGGLNMLEVDSVSYVDDANSLAWNPFAKENN